MRESRTEKRAAFGPDQRIILLEQDADAFEGSLRSIDSKLSRLLWAAMAGLISFSTASVLLAINLLQQS